MSKLSQEQFVEKCNKIHNFKYSYFKVNFISTKKSVVITCLNHGDFVQRASSHLSGNGCKLCAHDQFKLNKNIFIQKANVTHNYKYDYSLVNYVNNKEKIIIICPVHGEFKQTPRDHLQKKGCIKCKFKLIGNLKRKEIEFFIEQSAKIHNNKYDYTLVKYINNKTDIDIICPKHGAFKQIPQHHVKGVGCKACANRNISKLETKWLDSLNILNENRNIYIIINSKKYNVDGFDPATNTIYEFYGDYWHGNPNVKRFLEIKINKVNGVEFKTLYQNTLNREEELIKAGYKIVSIWESDFKNG